MCVLSETYYCHLIRKHGPLLTVLWPSHTSTIQERPIRITAQSYFLATTKENPNRELFQITLAFSILDRLCGLVVRVLGYRSGGPGSISSTTRKKKVVGLERGPLSLVSTTEELLDRKVAAPV
jgi:hypothetical protein